jgi:hypothetical protein
LAGWNGYTTTLTTASAEFVIDAYHQRAVSHRPDPRRPPDTDRRRTRTDDLARALSPRSTHPPLRTSLIKVGTTPPITDVTDLQTAIRTYNQRAKPFAWTKTADDLLGKIKRKSTNNTRH